MLGDFDLTRSVPVLSVTFLAITCFLSITVPVLALYIFRRKYRSSFRALLIGIADGLTLEYMLCNVIWMLLLLIPFIQSSPLAYIFIGIILGCVIFEGGRYLMIGLMERYQIPFSGLFLLATGISGTNSLLRTSIKSFESFVIAITINDTGLETLAAEAGENAVTMLQAIEPMLTCQPYVYLMNGLDVFVNLLFHVSACVLLYGVYHKRLPNYYLPVTAGLRLFYELPGYLYTYGQIITNAYLAEGISILAAAGIAYLAYQAATTKMPDKLASLTPEGNQAFPDFNANIRKHSIRDNANILSNRQDKDSL